MGKKDTCEKEYVANDEIFADIVNGMIFHGKQVVCPENLHEMDSTEVYTEIVGDDLLNIQKYRDALKSVIIKKDGKLRYMLVGMENQTSVSYIMAVRVMLYDAIHYMAQADRILRKHQREDGPANVNDYVSGIRKGDTLTPIITIVVYFGTKKWDAPRSLHELFSDDYPKEVLDAVPDYKICVLSPEDIKNPDIFRTDMREIVRALSACGKTNRKELRDMISSDSAFQTISSKAANIINTVTGLGLKIPEGKKEVNMCEAVQEWKEELLENGEEKLGLLYRKMLEANADMAEYGAATVDKNVRQRLYKQYGIS